MAVSGGKDSLALWDLLLDLGYDADGLYLGLGIGDYSDESGTFARAFAAARGLRLVEVDLRGDLGFDVPTAARATKRVPCSACGLSKRHLFDQAARDGGYDVLATGHNLDDEAAVLFGNTLRWDTEYLARQLPVLPERHGFPRKVKPLVRLTERETAAYCVLRGIDYQVEECPMAAGNKHLGYKDALNAVEAHVARGQGGVLLRVPRAGRAAVRPAVGRRAGRAPALCVVRRADDLRRCAPSAGWPTRPASTRPSRSRRRGPATVGRRPAGRPMSSTPFAAGSASCSSIPAAVAT